MSNKENKTNDELLNVHVTNREKFHLAQHAAGGGFQSANRAEAFAQDDLIRQLGFAELYKAAALDLPVSRVYLDPTIATVHKIPKTSALFFMKWTDCRMAGPLAQGLIELIRRVEAAIAGDYTVPEIVNNRIVDPALPKAAAPATERAEA